MNRALYAAIAVIISICGPAVPASARGGGHGFSFHSSSGVHYSRGYFRGNGTYVEGYHATNPNGTRNDNFSTRGNVNPYTGKLGTKPRDGELPGSYRGYGGSYSYSYGPGVAAPTAGSQAYGYAAPYANNGSNSVASTGPRHACTHAEQVQARIARMNQYTNIPNCE